MKTKERNAHDIPNGTGGKCGNDPKLANPPKSFSNTIQQVKESQQDQLLI
jgi:hypothetical protein